MSRSNRTARGRIRVSTARSETAQAPAAEAHGVPAKPHAKVRQAEAQAVAPPREPEELRAGALQARVTAAVGPSARPAQRTAWPA
jgi:hypothetical protein